MAKILHNSTRFYEIWCQFQSCVYSILAARKGLIGQWFTISEMYDDKMLLDFLSGSKTSTANTRKQNSAVFLFTFSEMYDTKRLQLCTHYTITIVQLISVNCSQVRKN